MCIMASSIGVPHDVYGFKQKTHGKLTVTLMFIMFACFVVRVHACVHARTHVCVYIAKWLEHWPGSQGSMPSAVVVSHYSGLPSC